MALYKILFIILFFPSLAFAGLYSANAGRVGDYVVTTREVMVYHLVEQAMNGPSVTPKIQLSQVADRPFVKETTSVLVENAVYFEADAFAVVPMKKEKVESEVRLVQSRVKKVKLWKELQVTSDELRLVVLKKMRAKEFVRFKIDSASIPISDTEARAYFDSNRMQFENLPYEKFKDNIKSYLTKQQVDRRLKDWFELLQSKYKVRNFLAE